MACLRGVLGFGIGTALTALLVGAPACFWHHKPAEGDPLRGSDSRIELRVTNHNFLDVAVSVLHDGQRTRVGTVTGSSSQVFLLPERLLGQGREIQLFGHPIGSLETVTTETIVVQPGQHVEWSLESQLARSTVAVY